MARSAASQEGIAEFGHRWRLEISLHGQPGRLADPDSLKVGDCASIRDSIVKRLRALAIMPSVASVLKADGVAQIMRGAERLEGCEDDPDELRDALDTLYDTFDYLRICVTR